MDNFMDKIAQKLSSQEVIRANSQADAAQLDKLNAQVAEYDACMKEMRKLNLKNVENEQKLQNLVEKSSEQIMKMFEENSIQMAKLAEECIIRIKELETSNEKDAAEAPDKECFGKLEKGLEEIKGAAAEGFTRMEEGFKQADDYVHKENVKVYRNVQAVVIEELEKQSQALMHFGETVSGKSKSIRIMTIITLIVSIINMGLLIVHLMGIF